ncbi:unnamed protein product [Effrenium voratum]|nr:unnamed protein product [Effrenium voratum]
MEGDRPAPFMVKRSGWAQAAQSHGVQQNWQRLDLCRVCLVSCSLDVALSAVSYPLWHLKTREQVLGSSAAQHCRELWRAQRCRGLYRGVVFATGALLPVNCLWCLAYEWSKWHLSQRLPAASAAPALAACAAECVWVAFAMPVENVAVRFHCRPPSEQLRWGASAAELKKLWQEGGVRRWWNGGLLGLASSLPQSAIWWMVYENSKCFLLPRSEREDLAQHGAAAGGAAVVASCATTLLLNPLDVVKSQKQVIRPGEASRCLGGSPESAAVPALPQWLWAQVNARGPHRAVGVCQLRGRGS